MSDQLVVVGIPAAALIVGLVQLLRALGMETRYTGAAATALGVLFAYLGFSVELFPDIEPWVRWVLNGVVLGLTAAGMYSQAAMWVKK